MAWNCCETPFCRMGCAGVSSIRVTVAAVTVMAALPVMPERTAATDSVPALTPVTFSLALALSMAIVARVVSEDVQAACAVMSCLVPSAKMPVAEMRMDCPTETGVTPSMEILSSGELETVTLAVAVLPW